MVRRWRIFGVIFASCFSASHLQHVSDLHPKFALRPHHLCSMVDIQYATAEKGEETKKNRKTEEETTGQKYNYNVGQCPP